MRKILTMVLIIQQLSLSAQLYISEHSSILIQKGAGLYVQGDINNYGEISGDGPLYLIDTMAQKLNMHNSKINSLYINNPDKILLQDDIQIEKLLYLFNGNVDCGNRKLILGKDASVMHSGQAGIFTGSAGAVRKYIARALQSFYLPLENENGSAGVLIQAAEIKNSGYLDISSSEGFPSNKPMQAQETISQYWRINRRNIQGKVFVTGYYLPAKNFFQSGNRQSVYYSSGKWKMESNKNQHAGNTASAEIPEGEGELYAISSRFNRAPLLVPNPAEQFTALSIYSDNNVQAKIVVTDAAGKIVIRQSEQLKEGMNRIIIQLAGLGKGYYDVVIESGAGNTTLRLIKR